MLVWAAMVGILDNGSIYGSSCARPGVLQLTPSKFLRRRNRMRVNIRMPDLHVQNQQKRVGLHS